MDQSGGCAESRPQGGFAANQQQDGVFRSLRVMKTISDVFEIRAGVQEQYADVVTPKALSVLAELAGLDSDRKAVMQARLERRRRRARQGERIRFLDPESTIPRAGIKVADARAGRFTGSRDSRRPQAPVGARDRSRCQTARAVGEEHSQCCVCFALRG